MTKTIETVAEVDPLPKTLIGEYSIKQERQNISWDIQARNLTILLNRRIAGEHPGKETQPNTIRVFVDPKNIIVTASQLKNTSLPQDYWDPYVKHMETLIPYGQEVLTNIDCRWSCSGDMRAGKHNIRGIVDTRFKKRGAFMLHGSCTQVDAYYWYSDNEKTAEVVTAIRFCLACPVLEECKKYIESVESAPAKNTAEVFCEGIAAAKTPRLRQNAYRVVYQKQRIRECLAEMQELLQLPDPNYRQRERIKTLGRVHRKLLKHLATTQKQLQHAAGVCRDYWGKALVLAEKELEKDPQKINITRQRIETLESELSRILEEHAPAGQIVTPANPKTQKQ